MIGGPDGTPAGLRSPALDQGGAALRRWLPRLRVPALLLRRGVVRAANAGALGLLGADRGQLQGRPLRTLLHGRGAAVHVCDAAGRAVPVELRTIAARGGEALVLLLARGAAWQRQAELVRRHATLQACAAGEAADHERQRHHVARVLHDQVQQNLAAAHLELRALRDTAVAAGPAAAMALARGVDDVARAQQACRELADELGPPLLEELGLVPALDALVARLAAATGCRPTCDWTAGEPVAAQADRARARVLFRAADAGLRAFAQAAPGAALQVVLRRFGDTGLVLAIEGEGEGPDPQVPPFPTLCDWARELHGDLLIDHPPTGGTRLRVHLDMRAEPLAAPGPAPDGDALLRLFYRLPVGVLQADDDGTVQMLNPSAARLLLPIVRPRAVDNLFEALAGVQPGLRERLAGAGLAGLELRRAGAPPVRLDLHRSGGQWLAVLREDT